MFGWGGGGGGVIQKNYCYKAGGHVKKLASWGGGHAIFKMMLKK